MAGRPPQPVTPPHAPLLKALQINQEQAKVMEYTIRRMIRRKAPPAPTQ